MFVQEVSTDQLVAGGAAVDDLPLLWTALLRDKLLIFGLMLSYLINSGLETEKKTGDAV